MQPLTLSDTPTHKTGAAGELQHRPPPQAGAAVCVQPVGCQRERSSRSAAYYWTDCFRRRRYFLESVHPAQRAASSMSSQRKRPRSLHLDTCALNVCDPPQLQRQQRQETPEDMMRTLRSGITHLTSGRRSWTSQSSKDTVNTGHSVFFS